MGLLRQSVFCLDNASDTGGFAARNSVILSRIAALSPPVCQYKLLPRGHASVPSEPR